MKIRSAKGFTLIELMIVVAIIGILAAIAIPNFLKFQLRSKFSELKTNVKGAFTANEAYIQREKDAAGSVNGQYRVIPNVPAVCTPGTAKNAWAAGDMAAAQSIDWIVEGATYGCYDIVGTPAPVPAANHGVAYTVSASSDIDGDGNEACVYLFKPKISALGTVATAAPDATCRGGTAVTFPAAGPFATVVAGPDDNTF